MGLSERGLSRRESRIKTMTKVRIKSEELEIIKNQSLLYLLPMLGSGISEFLHLKGVFMQAEEFPELQEHIFLLLEKSSDIISFSMTHERLKIKGNYFYEYDINKDFTLLIYTVPIYYLLDYDKFKEGKYSQFSEHYKQQILKFFECERGHYLERIMYKDPNYKKDLERTLSFTDDGFPLSPVSLKDQELADVPGERDIFKKIKNEER